jgi:purine-cytosine permease-like protein
MSPPATSQPAMDKVEAIQCSLRCFTVGLFGLLPLLGIPFAIVALADYFKVRRGFAGQWNPAQRYLTWGVATALCGAFLTIVIAVVLVGVIVLDLT